jgi:SAM-dependent methyltransferase
MQGYRASSYGDGFADVYDEWYPSGRDTDEVLDGLRRLAGPGPVLELGCGTGRLCLPLAAGGLTVVGLDASEVMLARLRAKPGADAMVTVAGDMADIDLSHADLTAIDRAGTHRSGAHLAGTDPIGTGPSGTDVSGTDVSGTDVSGTGRSGGDVPRFRLVFAAFNTLFNLPTADRQAACFRSVARHLRPEGSFAVECFVPGDAPGDLPGDGPPEAPGDAADSAATHTGLRDAIELRSLSATQVVLRVSRQDRAAQTVSGQHIELSEAGVRLRPWHLRYAAPKELDELAAAAGLALASRWASWSGEPFGDDSAQHVSVYRLRR